MIADKLGSTESVLGERIRMNVKISGLYIAAALCVLSANVFGQNRFEGYSVVVNATNEGICPVWYLPSAGNGNAIDVFVAGTGQKTPAPNITACDGASVRGPNSVFRKSRRRQMVL